MNHLHSSHYIVMFFIMILAGALSTMNIWADKITDVRFSLNDVYMILLMTGWMLFFMGLYYKGTKVVFIGALLVIINIWFIREQVFVNENQYKLGMIPHHSMAIHMSKKLLEKEKNSVQFLNNIINTQEDEILTLKKSKNLY